MQVNQKTYLFNFTSDLIFVNFGHSLFNVILLGVKMYDCFGSYFLGELVVINLVGRPTNQDSYLLF